MRSTPWQPPSANGHRKNHSHADRSIIGSVKPRSIGSNRIPDPLGCQADTGRKLLQLPMRHTESPGKSRISTQESRSPRPFPHVARSGLGMAAPLPMDGLSNPPSDDSCHVFSRMTFTANLQYLTNGYLTRYVVRATANPRYPQNPIIAFTCVIGYNQGMLNFLALPGFGRVLPVASDVRQTT